MVAHRVDGPIQASRLIALSDGTDLAQLGGELARLSGDQRIAVAVETPISALHKTFSGWSLRHAQPDDPLHLWRSVRAAIAGEDVPTHAPPSVFLSHAVADEPTIQPVVDYLRRYAGAEIFVCADSIQPGDSWRERIDAELRAAECFVLIGSAASFASTYCAFETGAALALDKPCRVIVLDGTSPPAFIGHIQAVDLQRHRARRPWLSHADALSDALADALSATSPNAHGHD